MHANTKCTWTNVGHCEHVRFHMISLIFSHVNISQYLICASILQRMKKNKKQINANLLNSYVVTTILHHEGQRSRALHVVSSSLHGYFCCHQWSGAVEGRKRCAWYRGRVRQSRVSRGRRDKPRRKASWASIGELGRKSEKERQTPRGREQGESRRGAASRKDRRVGAEGCLFWAAWTLPSSKPSEADGDSIPLASHSPSSRHELTPVPLSVFLSLSSSFLPHFARLSSFPPRRPRRCTRHTLASAAVAVLWKFWTNSKINSHRRGEERRDGLRRGGSAAPSKLGFFSVWENAVSSISFLFKLCRARAQAPGARSVSPGRSRFSIRL